MSKKIREFRQSYFGGPEKQGLSNHSTLDLCGLCRLQWHGIDIVDVGLLAYISSGKGCSSSQEQFYNLFDSSDWIILSGQSDNNNFYDFFSKSGNLSVIASKPTTTEWELYFGTVFYQFTVVSLLILPDEFIQLFLTWSKWESDLQSFDSVGEYLEKSTRIKPRNIVVTGYSWIGGVAQMLYMKYKCSAISFSSPGTYYTKGMAGILGGETSGLNIVTKGDHIAAVDFHEGLTFELECNTQQYKGRNCYSMRATVCALWSICNNGRSLNCA